MSEVPPFIVGEFPTIDDNGPTDEPIIDGPSENASGDVRVCTVCGDSFMVPAGARGRKPTKCPVHRLRDTQPRSTRQTKLSSSLGQQLTSLGILVSTVDPICGQAVIAGVPNLVAELDVLAAANPKVRRFLQASAATGGWFGVIAAVVPIAVPIAVHHWPSKQTFQAFRPMQPPSPPNGIPHDGMSNAKSNLYG